MKALTVTQPWASLVVVGAKRVETRSWKTNYRGRLAIHAAAKFPKDARELCKQWPFKEYVWDPEFLPTGAVLGTVKLVEVMTIERFLDAIDRIGNKEEEREEFAFGNFSPGRFAWIFEDPFCFKIPIDAKGALGLWEFFIEGEL